jgi:hypothetical protein
VTARVLPDRPACWSWQLPTLPMPNNIRLVEKWQEGRCAVCGVVPKRLVEDHDHGSGDTRGYLCEGCNVMEGQAKQRLVFALYRRQHPTSMLGVLHRYGGATHPVVQATEKAWREALRVARVLQDPAEDSLERAELGLRPRPLPEWTPLARAIARTGMTGREWGATLQWREDMRYTDEAHLPDEQDQPRNACGDGYHWRAPLRRGGRRKPCPECWEINPTLVREMVADGSGRPARGESPGQRRITLSLDINVPAGMTDWQCQILLADLIREGGMTFTPRVGELSAANPTSPSAPSLRTSKVS